MGRVEKGAPRSRATGSSPPHLNPTRIPPPYLQLPRPAGSLGALSTVSGGGVGASSAGRVGLCLPGSLGTGGPGSRERGRGGRRKWGRGGHSGLAAEGSPSERRDPDLWGGRKVPARIPPGSGGRGRPRRAARTPKHLLHPRPAHSGCGLTRPLRPTHT